VAIVCPNCGQENPEGFRLCGMCGAPLAAETEAREERKVVTVLFCDLVGSTAQAEGLDPEDVRALLSRFHAQVRVELERYGGTVEKFIGDAVMALFGAPVAHEDDPERAVRAALAIRDFARAEGTELRIGITTGEALIALGSRPSEGEGMASGDVVNTAARLQTAAPVNGIVVGAATYRSTRHVITYRELPAVKAKGKAEPIPIWEAVEGTSRFGVDVTHHAQTELVGRERELSVLRDALDRARHERIPQLVTLVGVPGMGKSRLVYELSLIADADPELITWRQGRCLAYGDGVAFWALAEIVKAQAGILERDTPTEAATKLRAAVDEILIDVNDARWVESHLRPLVGLETEAGLGGDRRGEAFAAWRRFLEALAEQRTLVLVLEDLHWADDGLLDFVDELVDWLSEVPLLVVCSARPELLERRPGWGGGKLNASALGLSPLSTEQTAALISHSLERSVLPAEIQQALLERAEGNPLYAEQFAQLYRERGSAEDLPLPESLQGIVAARLDGLSADAKALLQDAAVIGKVFWTGALRRSEEDVTPLLHALERKGFLTRQRRSSVESEGEWAFAHMLLRDVAYGQIPRGDRVTKHRASAEWIAGLGRPDDHAELLAYHWSSALELARAAGQDTADLVAPTRFALRDAGDRAFAVNAYPGAAAYFGDALPLWPDDEERPQLLYRLGDALYVANDARADAALEEARDALLASGDRETAAEAEVSLSRIWWQRGQHERARLHETRAEELVGNERSLAAARVLAFIARTRTIGGDLSEGLRLATEAQEMAETLKVEELIAHSLATIGLAKVYLGDPTGEDDEVRALEIAMAVNSPVAGSIANNVAVHAFFSFDFRRTDELFDEGLRIAERLGDASGARWLRAQVASTAFFLGRWDESLRLLDEFILECEAGSPHYMEGTAHRERGRIKESRGDAAGAIADFEGALLRARAVNDPQELLPDLAAVSAAFETRGRVDEARTLARELIDIARSQPQDAAYAMSYDFLLTRVAFEHESELREIVGNAPFPKWKSLNLACLDRDFVRAADMWAEGASPTMAARLRLRAAEELIDAGHHREGVEQLEKALDFYHSVGATFYINLAEELLAETA
jgi:class 3 adenylate cyclase/tetratricopeptide (TPR) repeat protein